MPEEGTSPATKKPRSQRAKASKEAKPASTSKVEAEVGEKRLRKDKIAPGVMAPAAADDGSKLIDE